MNAISMRTEPITKRVRAIVQFGPALAQSGEKPAEYYQVTIDPNMTSPGGLFIRFGAYKGDEINGWQRIDAMTVAEILGEAEKFEQSLEGYTEEECAKVSMRMLVTEGLAVRGDSHASV